MEEAMKELRGYEFVTCLYGLQPGESLYWDNLTYTRVPGGWMVKHGKVMTLLPYSEEFHPEKTETE